MPWAAKQFGSKKKTGGQARIKRVGARPSACKRGYGRKWQKASKAYLLRHPLCKIHENENRVVAATCVDHVVPHKGDMKVFWDPENWQGLCTTCHNRKTAREDGGFGNR